ncbi:hypothetical protein ACPEIF_20135 [Streptomyces sp. NPDC012600]|uniref:hypothetical protein n=1 Tax=Streptomyces sp. NPDC012600 TaxID=3415005 RepID=UPI003C2C3E6B
MGSHMEGLVLDETAVEKFTSLLQDEGVMRAGFVAHQANNLAPQEQDPIDV